MQLQPLQPPEPSDSSGALLRALTDGKKRSGFVRLCKAGAAAALLQGRFSSD